jgi:hypothetical protein
MDLLFMCGECWAIVCPFLTTFKIINPLWIGPVTDFLQRILHFGIYVALFVAADTGVGVMDRPPECPTFEEGAQCRLLDCDE